MLSAFNHREKSIILLLELRAKQCVIANRKENLKKSKGRKGRNGNEKGEGRKRKVNIFGVRRYKIAVYYRLVIFKGYLI